MIKTLFPLLASTMKSPLEGHIQEYSYQEAITLINQHFIDLNPEELKDWADKHNIYYYTLTAIMKGKTSNDLPGNVTKILERIGFKVKIKKYVTYILDKKPFV